MKNNPMPIRLEDNFEDILQKSAKGLGLGKLGLMEKSGLSMMEIEPLLEGNLDPTTLFTLGSALQLNPEALVRYALGEYYPEVSPMEHLHLFNHPHPIPGYEEMTVNSCCIQIPNTNDFILFDTGGNFESVSELLKKHKGKLVSIFYTHGHSDHRTDHNSFLKAFHNIPAYAHPEENIPETSAIAFGSQWTFGPLKVTAHQTNGHSPAGTSFLIEGLENPACIIGDAIFAGSIGGIPQEYPKHLKNLKSFLAELAPETILVPGHGPCSTAKLERQHNPFFAAT